MYRIHNAEKRSIDIDDYFEWFLAEYLIKTK